MALSFAACPSFGGLQVTRKTPIALTIAGSDSGGGAGVQADLKSFSANSVYGASVLTAITAQNTLAVTAIHELPADMVLAQIKAVLSDLVVGAIKLGMLCSPSIVAAVAEGLRGYGGPVVVDPVMIAKSGDALLQDAAISALIGEILPRADLLTPNLPEAARLLGEGPAETIDQMIAQGTQLLDLGPGAILMKAGHATGATCRDVLIQRDGATTLFEAPRIATANTHGTGCTYSAAIAAGLARGHAMPDAVGHAHAYLKGAIAAADDLNIGAGHGPVHHFYALWT